MDNKESTNPFTGLPNSTAIRLQSSWENILEEHYGINTTLNVNNIENKFRKSTLYLPSETNDFAICYEQICPTSIQFSYEVKI
jgi:hypothetical protein